MQPFEHVVAEHGAVVMRVCRALLPPADADDAWAETFLAALRAYPGLRPDSDIRAWLVTIAHRKAIDVLRGRARRALPVEQVPERAGADDDVALGDVDGELWAAVAALPCKQRAAVVYHHVADLPYVEVGAAMGTSPAAARRNAADGIAALRRRYRPAPDA